MKENISTHRQLPQTKSQHIIIPSLSNTPTPQILTYQTPNNQPQKSYITNPFHILAQHLQLNSTPPRNIGLDMNPIPYVTLQPILS